MCYSLSTTKFPCHKDNFAGRDVSFISMKIINKDYKLDTKVWKTIIFKFEYN